MPYLDLSKVRSKIGAEGHAPVAQGIGQRFPNPKFCMGVGGKRWKLLQFAGFARVAE